MRKENGRVAVSMNLCDDDGVEEGDGTAHSFYWPEVIFGPW